MIFSNISPSEQCCSRNLLEEASFLRTNIYTLDKIDICGMCSLPHNIGIKRMDGYTVSDDNNRWYGVYALKSSNLILINFYFW